MRQTLIIHFCQSVNRGGTQWSSNFTKSNERVQGGTVPKGVRRVGRLPLVPRYCLKNIYNNFLIRLKIELIPDR